MEIFRVSPSPWSVTYDIIIICSACRRVVLLHIEASGTSSCCWIKVAAMEDSKARSSVTHGDWSHFLAWNPTFLVDRYRLEPNLSLFIPITCMHYASFYLYAHFSVLKFVITYTIGRIIINTVKVLLQFSQWHSYRTTISTMSRGQ